MTNDRWDEIRRICKKNNITDAELIKWAEKTEELALAHLKRKLHVETEPKGHLPRKPRKKT